MSAIPLFFAVFICLGISKCNGITNYENEKNIIGDQERRGVTVNEDGVRVNDQRAVESTKRGLWLINQHQQPSGYSPSGLEGGYHGSSTGPGGYGYTDSGGYGATDGGYHYGSSGGGGYHKGNNFGQGFGYTGGGSNFGHNGFGHGGFGHSGYGDQEHEMSHDQGGSNRLALKKLLIPLAGLAILGAAAAALSSNPILLQLGTIQSGRRRKRSVTSRTDSSNIYPPNPWIRPDILY